MRSLSFLNYLNKILALLALIILFANILANYYRQITAFTQDLGRHLLFGKIILETHNVPKNNLISYTYPNFEFINHHYLSQVIFYLIEKDLGLKLLLVFSTSIIIITFALLCSYTIKKYGIFPVVISLFFLLPILFERTDIRPEIFSFFLTGIFLIILFEYRSKKTRLIYLLPFFTLLWVQLHIYFFIGIFLIFLFFLDRIFVHINTPCSNQIKTLGVIMLLSVSLSMINPNGFYGAIYPINAFKNYGYAIEENQNIFLLDTLGFQKESLFFFKTSSVILLLLLLVNIKRSRPIDWLLSLSFIFLGISSVRNIPLFTICCLIPFSKYIHDFFFKNKIEKTGEFLKFLCVFLIIFLTIGQITKTISKKPFGFSVINGGESAVDFFKQNKLEGPIFNNFDIGSYLAYRLYPGEKIFVDGRPEAYPSSFFQDIYIPMQENPTKFDERDRYYKFNSIIFSHTDQTPWGNLFLKSIINNDRWSPVYLDETIIIFIKNNSKNNTLIKKFGMTKNNILPKNLNRTEQSLLQLASFFNKTENLNMELKQYQEILKINPRNCIALRNAGIVANAINDQLAQSYFLSYSSICK